MTPERLARIKQTLNTRQPDLRVLTDQVHKPRNLSAIIRSCDAFGVANMHVVWPREGFRAFRKTAGGSFNWVTTHTHPSMADALAVLKSQGHRLYAAQLSERAVDFRTVDYTVPCVIVMGNEVDGVSAAAAAEADEHIVIPMMGMVESLNVSAACAIILSEAQRQRRQAGLYDHRRLPEDEYRRLLFSWCQPTVKRYCDDRNLPYPPLDPDTGELIDGVGWMREVRKQRANRTKQDGSPGPAGD
ncbi:tRNA (guanosine(18)-2'-O)-methyltransferase TrmH [Marinobacter lutaoensis]|jgi:tRNA (guanosine-2'-O-)-methyltransferase|uniref:tRNA (guanosine(18)-2'-O)-methyltransferase TrmH n=1 Tax=Marinobacter lutaoensis TaxID=135739 RepID=UPI000C0BABEB|nr:tRNA (guanosine(18)-2'-O)-methyltransferase TrmH [Marinobacter lutaoensis]MBE03328.1 tRNA (guanosine(18)-2'-O)-methyltransferase TrmH [Marinobacter sp.]MBI43282.1 tRNA (guanosine(18)-2'-O)-methyltransferase TrmH [Oceanospirillales bacterium]NVD34937.1 tRNA (guanosine(18)-2'-O)-methyltransferase TrmH [Marinobacter lutaoensis]